MDNDSVAKILFEIGEILEMEGVPFKPRAYQKAAISIDHLEDSLLDIYKKEGIKGIEKIPGIGKSISEKIEEYIETGRIKYYEKLKKESPVDLENLLKIEGLGPKKIKVLFQELQIKNVEQLEKAIDKDNLVDLDGFGEKTQENIKKGIEFLKEQKGRFLISEISKDVEKIITYLKKIKEVKKIEVAGSFRRRKETIGDLDILIVSSFPEKIMNCFTTMDDVVRIWARGATKSSVRVKKGYDVDLRVVPLESFGAALQYFTGSKDHNVHLRRIAIKKGYKLNEYGLYNKEKCIAGKNEVEIYKKLGLDFVEPQLREDRGEIELAESKMLPNLIKLSDLKGDLHCHTSWNGGVNSIEEMVLTAKKLGYEYLGISDHTKDLTIENGLDEKKLEEQSRAIKKINEKLKGFKVLHGAEVNILKDGSLDIKNSTLKELDYVNIGIHSGFKMKMSLMTERILKALSNPYVTSFNHPTGRIVNIREGYQVDLEEVFKFAKQKNILLEINSSQRLDLSDINIKRAKDVGCKFLINTDAHDVNGLNRMQYGIYQAQRGFLEAKNVLNTRKLKEIEKFLKK